MATKTCLDCGETLTLWNRSFGCSKCSDCARVPFSDSQAFFERTKIGEQQIKEYPIFKTAGKLIGCTLLVLLGLVLGTMVGFGNGGTYAGLLGGFLGACGAVLLFRWLTKWLVSNPLDVKRVHSYLALGCGLPIFAWIMAYMGLMPVPCMFLTYATLFSFHVRITPSLHVPAFWLVCLVGLAGAILGVIVGLVFVAGQDRRHKAKTLIHFHRWREAALGPVLSVKQ